MRFQETALKGVFLVEADVFGDHRGYFMEAYNAADFKTAGVVDPVLQVSQSMSTQGTIRGLHFQSPNSQGKLVRPIAGAMFDVAVDVRHGSPTFCKWVGVELDASRYNAIWLPPGFAHGFAALSETVEILYLQTVLYAPQFEKTVRWNDPSISVDWPFLDPILSEKDRYAPLLKDIEHLPLYRGGDLRPLQSKDT